MLGNLTRIISRHACMDPCADQMDPFRTMRNIHVASSDSGMFRYNGLGINRGG